MEPNLTALVSCFARAYHTTHNPAPVFRDTAAQALLTEEESAAIAAHMAAGVSFFVPGFQGSAEEALRAVAEGHLAPAVVARSAFCEGALRSAAAAGCTQYLLFAAGYDTFSVRPHSPALTVYELDRPAVLADKRARLDRAGLRLLPAGAALRGRADAHPLRRLRHRRPRGGVLLSGPEGKEVTGQQRMAACPAVPR